MSKASFAELQSWLSYYEEEPTTKDLINFAQANICFTIYSVHAGRNKQLKFEDFLFKYKKEEEKPASWFSAEAKKLNEGLSNG